jgi:hypothetical protein
MGNLTPNFDVEDFGAKGSRDTWNLPRLRRLAWNLEVIIDASGGRKMTITSGCREPKSGRKYGDEYGDVTEIPSSGCHKKFHTCCEAADFTLAGLSNRKAHALVRKLRAEGRIDTGGLGLYPNPYIHVDIRRPDWAGADKPHKANELWYQCKPPSKIHAGGDYQPEPCRAFQSGAPEPIKDWKSYPTQGSLSIRSIYPTQASARPLIPKRFSAWASQAGQGRWVEGKSTIYAGVVAAAGIAAAIWLWRRRKS